MWRLLEYTAYKRSIIRQLKFWTRVITAWSAAIHFLFFYLFLGGTTFTANITQDNYFRAALEAFLPHISKLDIWQYILPWCTDVKNCVFALSGKIFGQSWLVELKTKHPWSVALTWFLRLEMWVCHQKEVRKRRSKISSIDIYNLLKKI